MCSPLLKLFDDPIMVNKIRNRLPYLFQLAEMESSRGGKVGMEVGSIREKIIIALLIYKFGEDKVKKVVSITESEVDVKVYGHPLSIKTISGKSFSGVKLIWTVDEEMAKKFKEAYQPVCDILLVQIVWGDEGHFFYIPLNLQKKVFNEIGKDGYLKLPKKGTNPRGVEITVDALKRLIEDQDTRRIVIKWIKRNIKYNPYKRWVDLWKEEDEI